MKDGLSRIRIIWGAIALVALVYTARLWWLQVVRADVYTQQADHQYAAGSGGVYDRGSIFFSSRDGKLISAASLESGLILAIKPDTIPDVAQAYKELSAVFPIDREEFLSRANKRSDTYEEIAHHISDADAAKIRALNEPWIVLSREKWRFYPGGDLASHVLGFVGYSGNTLSGRYGLERYYDDVLTRDNENPYANIFVQIFSDTKDAISHQTLQGDIISTIEPTVQGALQEELATIEEKWHPDKSGAIVINPQNGEIYAMAVSPTFNLNSFSKETDPHVFSNPMVENVYEMGSIVKPLTMAIGVDTGSITPETTYLDEGTIFINGARLSNFDGRARGTVSMQEVLNQSLNTGAAFVEHSVGNKRFADYLLKLGFGEETGIDLPNETYGLVSNLKSPRDLEYATASFGQGIALTPIEIVRALCSLANGGWLVTPHAVSSVQYDVGLTHSIAAEDRIEVFKPETTEAVSRMLVEVYDKALANGTVKIKNYSIAAKTGTAQIAKPDGGGYYEDRYLHSFFGYFPAYDPKFLIFFFAVHPKGALYASGTLTDPFVHMVKFLINYYHVPPDR